MKTIIIILFLLPTFSFALDESNWTTTMGEMSPSCFLYRKRVANYYQRVSELNTAEKALSGKLSVNEISKMVELWERVNIPLLASETATFSTRVEINELALLALESINEISVLVESDLFNWESESFIFPDEVMEVNLDRNQKVININFHMAFAQACLRSTKTLVHLRPKGNAGVQRPLSFEIIMDKTSWDKTQI